MFLRSRVESQGRCEPLQTRVEGSNKVVVDDDRKRAATLLENKHCQGTSEELTLASSLTRLSTIYRTIGKREGT